jgi:hypothetical protein
MDLFFNELSLEQVDHRAKAHTLFEALGKCYQSAAVHGFKEIKVPNVFFGHTFAEAYTFFEWANDRDFDPDLRTLLKSKITTTPSIEELYEKNWEDKQSFAMFQLEGRDALGLGAASSYVFDSIAISLSTQERWDESMINLKVLTDEGEQNCEVRHVSKAEHLAVHINWLEQKKKNELRNGQQLWLKRHEHFPNLDFCEHIRGQLMPYGGNQPEFIQLRKRLLELEVYASQRASGEFDPDQIPSKTTPESETRLRDFANELNRLCTDGETREFNWHVRFTPGAGRIHFYPLEDSQVIIIGNIANQNEIK